MASVTYLSSKAFPSEHISKEMKAAFKAFQGVALRDLLTAYEIQAMHYGELSFEGVKLSARETITTLLKMGLPMAEDFEPQVFIKIMLDIIAKVPVQVRRGLYDYDRADTLEEHKLLNEFLRALMVCV